MEIVESSIWRTDAEAVIQRSHLGRTKLKLSKRVWRSTLLVGTTLLSIGQPSPGIQQIANGTTRVVVVLIPGFPPESILLGFLVGLLSLALIRHIRSRRLKRVELTN